MEMINKNVESLVLQMATSKGLPVGAPIRNVISDSLDQMRFLVALEDKLGMFFDDSVLEPFNLESLESLKKKRSRDDREARSKLVINDLAKRGLLSVVECDGKLLGYRFSGSLLLAQQKLDALLTSIFEQNFSIEHHSCTTLLPRNTLDRIQFFKKLPILPFWAVPHGELPAEPQASTIVLSPSTCYHTFAHVADTDQPSWPLKIYSAVGNCHRFETSDPGPYRMGQFLMREFVFIGERDLVESKSDQMLSVVFEWVNRLTRRATIERASDVFYGDRSEASRKVQLALGVKKELVLSTPNGAVSVGSRNYHRDLFTNAFNIGPQESETRMHSACVAFGLERITLAFLSEIPNYDTKALLRKLEQCFEPSVLEAQL